jgi:hypothetical protein
LSLKFLIKGLISYEDFKRVFQLSEDELESRGGGNDGESNFESIPPKNIPELVDIQKVNPNYFLTEILPIFVK